MSFYKMKSTEKGKRYWIGNPKTKKDGTEWIQYVYISEEKIPRKIVEALVDGTPLDERDLVGNPPVRQCLIDNSGARMSRMVEGQTVYLCDDHYYDLSIGKIAAKLKELNYV